MSKLAWKTHFAFNSSKKTDFAIKKPLQNSQQTTPKTPIFFLQKTECSCSHSTVVTDQWWARIANCARVRSDALVVCVVGQSRSDAFGESGPTSTNCLTYVWSVWYVWFVHCLFVCLLIFGLCVCVFTGNSRDWCCLVVVCFDDCLIVHCYWY